MATLCLVCEDSSAAGRYEVGDQPLVVGRGEAADVTIEDDALSRQHFLVLRQDDSYMIEDLNSRNGTWVGGRRILAAKLRHNDIILAGHTVFRFMERTVATSCSRRRTGPHGTVVLAALPELEAEEQLFA
jgi:pSer/pThr/pTyr-binding forkhead associated (FHA) protein